MFSMYLVETRDQTIKLSLSPVSTFSWDCGKPENWAPAFLTTFAFHLKKAILCSITASDYSDYQITEQETVLFWPKMTLLNWRSPAWKFNFKISSTRKSSNTRRSYHTSHLYYVRIDGMASIVIIFLLYGDARSHNYLVPGSVYPTTLCQKTIWILRLADADGGNRTRATSAASDRAIHYTIAPRHQGGDEI